MVRTELSLRTDLAWWLISWGLSPRVEVIWASCEESWYEERLCRQYHHLQILGFNGRRKRRVLTAADCQINYYLPRVGRRKYHRIRKRA